MIPESGEPMNTYFFKLGQYNFNTYRAVAVGVVLWQVDRELEDPALIEALSDEQNPVPD